MSEVEFIKFSEGDSDALRQRLLGLGSIVFNVGQLMPDNETRERLVELLVVHDAAKYGTIIPSLAVEDAGEAFVRAVEGKPEALDEITSRFIEFAIEKGLSALPESAAIAEEQLDLAARVMAVVGLAMAKASDEGVPDDIAALVIRQCLHSLGYDAKGAEAAQILENALVDVNASIETAVENLAAAEADGATIH